jgi:hypothetical protein
MDKSVISRAVTVAGGRFAPGHLGELTRLVPFEMVDAALAETRRVQRRVRDLPSRVVVYLLLAGCLFAELGYAQVWHRLTAGLGGLPLAAPTASAMTQARRRLGPAPLRELFFLLRGPGPGGARWKGLLVVAVGGTVITVADSAANLAVYSKQRGGPSGGGSYPTLRLLALVSCGTRTVIDAVFEPVSAASRHTPGRCCAACARAWSCSRTGTSSRATSPPRSRRPARTSWSGSAPGATARSSRSCAAAATGPDCHPSAASPCGSSTPRSSSRPPPGAPPAGTD